MLKSILSQPTAPFRESWVKARVLAHCARASIPVWEDEIGNLWLNARKRQQASKASLVLVAHLDHPGMVITGFRKQGKRLLADARWLGGGPMGIRGFPVRVFSEVNGQTVLEGKVIASTRGPRGPAEVTLELRPSAQALSLANDEGFRLLGPWGACLWFGGVPEGIKTSGRRLITKAADDLVGACALIDALGRSGLPRGVVVLLSRAEESGFHGTLHALTTGKLKPRQTLMISVEASSERPWAGLGKGPIVRLGDLARVFDPDFMGWIQAQAELLSKKDTRFHFQRQVMDGGTCEASAFGVFGFRVGGLATPLKNYHNQSPSQRPLPEEVDLGDVEALTQLLAGIMRAHRRTHLRPEALGKLAFTERKKRMTKGFAEQRRYFNGT